MKINTFSKKGGFTLIELLVVIAIIVILTALILPDLAGSRAKARDAQRISDVSQLQLALELFYDRCGQYPAAVSSGSQYVVSSASNCTTSSGTIITMSSFIAQIPTPPAGVSNVTGYDYATSPISGSINNYVLRAQLESNNAEVSKGLSVFPTTGTWSNPITCTNTGTFYCVGPQ